MKTKNNEIELYKAVEAGLLEIDSKGRIWKVAEMRGNRWNQNRAKHRVMRRRAEHDQGQYLQVRRMVAGKRTYALAHRLVWMHFNGPIPQGLQINHKNGNKKDNRPANLELATSAQNTRHAVRVLGVGRAANQHGEKNRNAKLTQAQVQAIRSRRAQGDSLKAIASEFGVTFQTVSKIARGNRW